jgi:hypothetical protein
MKRFSTANRIAINLLDAGAVAPRASFLGEYMTAPTYFAGDVDYTGFYLHHCVHYFDLVPHLMDEWRIWSPRYETVLGIVRATVLEQGAPAVPGALT